MNVEKIELVKPISPPTVEDYLNNVDYEFMGYMPTDEALRFVNFIKAVNGGEEENKTPIVHLVMMERVFNQDRRCAIMCHRGIGKRQTLNSVIYTPDGSTTMGNISIGDKVLTRDGVETIVTFKTAEEIRPTYRIHLSDGSSIEVDEEHNNIVWPYRKKDRERIMTTKELLEKELVVELDRVNNTQPKVRYNYSIPLASPAQHTYKQFDVHPYVLGLMLADGHFGSGQISCHLDDMIETAREVSKCGYSINGMKSTSENGGRIQISAVPFKPYWSMVGEDKKIPTSYMFGSIEQRQALLQGLMDGDGSIKENGSSRYHTVNKNLAEGVRDLVRSLGGISYIKEYERDDKETYDVEYVVIVNIKLNPFRLKRKADKWKPTKKTSRAITSIEYIGELPGHCIQVEDETHSYLTDGYTVTHNTTLFAEYLILYVAAFGEVPGFGKVSLMLYVTDSIENGVKNLRRNVEFRYQESEFLQHIIPNQSIKVGTDDSGFVGLDEYENQSAGGRKFTDIRLEFMNNKGHRLVVKGYGAKALSLDTRLYTVDGYTTIGECAVGQEIYGPDGQLAKITAKSEVFNKPMYKLQLEDGRFLKVSEDHINSVMINTQPNGVAKWEDHDLTTKELLGIGWLHTKKGNVKHKGYSNKCIMKIRNTEPLVYSEKEFKVDPYTLGLLLGDGSIKKDASGVVLTGLKEDTDFYRLHIPYEQGEDYIDKRTESVNTFAIKGINQSIRELRMDDNGSYHGNHKYIPEEYFFGSIEQRLELLKGLLDTDGSISVSGRIDFSSVSELLANDVVRLVRSLGGKGKMNVKLRSSGAVMYRPELWIGMNPFKLPRKAARYKADRLHWNNVNVVDIQRIEDEPSQCIAIDSDSHQFLAGEYFRTHNTGVRGAKEMGQRPQMAILDDLISDEDARSATIIETIENTIYKAVSKALHPTKQKMVFIGTPFNANDPLYKAVESGAWTVSVFPICEKYPVTKEEFRGSWEDRFTYNYVKAEYDEAIALHKPENFNQELMLRIMSEEDRLVQDDDIVWFSRRNVLKNKSAYNFYITTDFATSAKKGADFSVISVWAYNNNGDWMLVDGVCQQQLMDQNMNDLFRLVSMYKPLGVGIEVSGQQGGFIRWIKNEMIEKNIFFNLASSKNSNEPGIRPSSDKLTRFNQVLPMIKAKKIWFAEEMKDTAYGRELVDELINVSKKGFKSKHDDVCDTISMLSEMDAYKPTEEVTPVTVEFNANAGYWSDFDDDDDDEKQSTIF